MKFTNVEKLSFIEHQRRDRTNIDDDANAIAAWEDSRRDYYAFTSLAHAARLGSLFCGTTNFGNDLLHAYDLASGSFESMDYASIAEPVEIKIHRSLTLGGDGCVYGATSCLSGYDALADAPGGKLWRFDPAARQYEVLGIPVPHLYIQTISLDWDRQMVYGMTIPGFIFFAFSLVEREVVYSLHMGSISHIGVVDPDGGYWGTWLGGGRSPGHNLFRYDPKSNRVKFFDRGFPTPCRNLMYRGAGPIDSTLVADDGQIYLGHESGELYRLDWRQGRVEYLCKPMPGQRMPGLASGPDGLLLGVGGSDWASMGFVYDRKTGASEVLGPIRDDTAQADCFRTHDCCLVGDDLFVGETDHPQRGCYLWKCTVG